MSHQDPVVVAHMYLCLYLYLPVGFSPPFTFSVSFLDFRNGISANYYKYDTYSPYDTLLTVCSSKPANVQNFSVGHVTSVYNTSICAWRTHNSHV